MKRVIGIGGIFFISKNPDKLKQWYQKHLGLNIDQYGTLFIQNTPEQTQYLQWSVMQENNTMFNASQQSYMINYRVHNLEELYHALKNENVKILDEIQTYDYGKFLHILDLDGNKIELWEAIDQPFDSDEFLKTP